MPPRPQVLNYSRIYGAGQTHTAKLLVQWGLTKDHAKKRAAALFKDTKGERGYVLNAHGIALARRHKIGGWDIAGDDVAVSAKQGTYLIKRRMKDKPKENFMVAKARIFKRTNWQNGTESAMFNQLEAIAMQDEPRTPVLQCKIRYRTCMHAAHACARARRGGAKFAWEWGRACGVGVHVALATSGRGAHV